MNHQFTNGIRKFTYSCQWFTTGSIGHAYTFIDVIEELEYGLNKQRSLNKQKRNKDW